MDGINNIPQDGRANGDILFSKTVKAGKRVYYIDVKRDTKGEYYLSMTESKRVKDAPDTQRPVFEKHKLFLYREDMERFKRAFDEAVSYIQGKQQELEDDAFLQSDLAHTALPGDDCVHGLNIEIEF